MRVEPVGGCACDNSSIPFVRLYIFVRACVCVCVLKHVCVSVIVCK